MLKQFLERELTVVLNSILKVEQPVKLEYPKNADHGQYALSVAFNLAKLLKNSPKIIAEELAATINDSEALPFLTATALNGFINLTLSDDYLLTYLAQVLVEKNFAVTHEKINLEYVSANPTGPLHIGHGRWAVMGSTIASILKYTGHNVDTEFYINDAGSQIQNFRASVDAVKNGAPIPEDGYHGDYVKQLAQSDEDPVLNMVSQQKTTLGKLGVYFDCWFSELSLHQQGNVEDTINWLKDSGLVYENEGALWFRSSEFGDDKDRVLIKADGAYTYFLVDIAYHYNKFKRCDFILNIWGADHHGYVPRMKAAVSSFLEKSDKVDQHFKVLIGQLVSLVRNGEPVRMSKRTGDMIQLDEVIDEIGSDATRFFLVQKSADTHIEFDLDLAKKKTQENPVYYVQYAHARMASILEKITNTAQSYGGVSIMNAHERFLVINLVQFQDKVWDAAIKLSPYLLVQYALDLAKAFHLFYHHCHILNADNDEDKQRRLYILRYCKLVLSECLAILGISAPNKM